MPAKQIDQRRIDFDIVDGSGMVPDQFEEQAFHPPAEHCRSVYARQAQCRQVNQGFGIDALGFKTEHIVFKKRKLIRLPRQGQPAIR